ncbi:protein cereblon isoform X2 [Thrips palmi]|uniref:Protein cereblon n=1 Tax=Thrips palmi TaxID=161013 RepID=A0A6P8YG13_THRPL|nr:protein cereblon isoform X2 [Thrips palmi]
MDPDSTDSDSSVDFEIDTEPAFVLDDLVDSDSTPGSGSADSEFIPSNPGTNPMEHTFDPSLPSQHSYLGTDLTVLYGRTVLDEDDSNWIPLYPQVDVVLVPGQTLPLAIFNASYIQMIRQVISGNRTFGTICMLRKTPGSDELSHADVGTTAEIYEAHESASHHAIRVKAIGRQRFKILETTDHTSGFLTARVRILPEVKLPDPLSMMSCPVLDRFRTKANIGASTKRKHNLRLYDSISSIWPAWVYDQYDPERLVKQMLEILSCHKAVSPIPTDPVALSYWVARSLPIKDSRRLVLLRMNSAIDRLRWEIFTLNKLSLLCCRQCGQHVAHQQDVFSMSVEGMQGTYCNVYGYVYETVTIHKATGLRLQNAPPSTEFSWFPGYAWTVAACSRCRKHMGWHFTATSPDMKPRGFWGLCRRALEAKLEEVESTE